MKKENIEEIKKLKTQGKTYHEIAKILKISSFTAYKYGESVHVQTEEKAQESKELAPKKRRDFVEDVQQAKSVAFVMNVIHDTAIINNCGKRKKGKFYYDTSSEKGLKYQGYEKMIKKTKGFILPQCRNVLRDCFVSYRARLLELRDVSEHLVGELKEATEIDLPKIEGWDDWDECEATIKEKFQTMNTALKTLREENKEFRDREEEFKRQFSSMEKVVKELEHRGGLINKQHDEIKELKGKLKSMSVELAKKEDELKEVDEYLDKIEMIEI